MKVDWTINAGELIAAALLLVGFLTAHTQNIRKLQDIETKVGLMFDWYKQVIRRSGRDDD